MRVWIIHHCARKWDTHPYGIHLGGEAARLLDPAGKSETGQRQEGVCWILETLPCFGVRDCSGLSGQDSIGS